MNDKLTNFYYPNFFSSINHISVEQMNWIETVLWLIIYSDFDLIDESMTSITYTCTCLVPNNVIIFVNFLISSSASNRILFKNFRGCYTSKKMKRTLINWDPRREKTTIEHNLTGNFTNNKIFFYKNHHL